MVKRQVNVRVNSRQPLNFHKSSVQMRPFTKSSRLRPTVDFEQKVLIDI